MERVTVSVSFSLKDLKRLDDWKDARRQTRSAAIMSLLDLATAPVITQGVGGRWDTDEQMLSENPQSRLEKARAVLERAESGENAGAFDVTPEPQILKRKDPLDQSPEWDDSYAQDPPQDDVDQRAKRRGK